MFDLTAGLVLVFWLYIDDIGILVLENSDFPDSQELILTVRRQVRRVLRHWGLGIHKEQLSDSVLSVGIQLGGCPPKAQPLLERRWLAIECTEIIAVLPICLVSWVETLQGVLGWMMLTSRGALSIFDQIYGFTREHHGEQVAAIPPAVRRELLAAANLCLIFGSDWSADWVQSLFMTDASPTGGALVHTAAQPEQLRQVGSLSSSGGWLVNLEDPEDKDSFSSPKKVPRSLKVKLYRFIHLFSGPPREGDIKWHIEDWFVLHGTLCIVDCVDLEAVPPVDALEEWTTHTIKRKARVRWWQGGHAGPPCSTWSRVLWIRNGGPTPYRSRRHLWGLPGLPERKARRCQDGER